MLQQYQYYRDFQILSILGHGSFSIVYKVLRLKDQKYYALKQIPITTLTLNEKQNSLNEVRLLASFDHENILKFKECFIDDITNQFFIVTEFCSSGTLQDLLDEHIQNGSLIEEKLIWNYLIEILIGLSEIHKLNIIHRDLKCANIFLTESGKLKIGDFNISTVIENDWAKTQTGTPFYASPEVWRKEQYDQKSDIWSLGCMLYELCNLEPPFKGNNLHGLFQEIQQGEYQPINKNYSNQLAKIIQLCLKINQVERPTCQDLLYNPIIHHIIKQNNKLISQQKQKLFSNIKWSEDIQKIVQFFPKENYNDTKINYFSPQRLQYKSSFIESSKKNYSYSNNLTKQNSLKTKKKSKIFEPMNLKTPKLINPFFPTNDNKTQQNKNCQKQNKDKMINLNIQIQQNIQQVNQIQLIQINNNSSNNFKKFNSAYKNQKNCNFQFDDEDICDEGPNNKNIYEFKANSSIVSSNSITQIQRQVPQIKQFQSINNNSQMSDYISKIVKEVESNKKISQKNVNTEKLISECLNEINQSKKAKFLQK